ncbi:unnamed protein product [Cuscuta epithymum]|uniref:Protein IQ-DOMAIN 1 n=1 Tax=Cuscuta epithymum TaxID=186058 RepID=A0AAV0FQE3_9ASTE|nr:unnamed protein product [Cuscuta epithymum]CAH9137881.1 unnamed protein product [Cuscuta epithymum]
MGSGEWFKKIINLKKEKDRRGKKGFKGTTWSKRNNYLLMKEPPNIGNGISDLNVKALSMPVEHIAAIRIQKAFRGHMARKTLHRLKVVAKIKILTDGNPVKRQTLTTLRYLHNWAQMQAEIRGRRACMVVEGLLRQKKLENQSKLEAKLQNLEVEWSNSPETKEEALARIHQREDAAVKRERALSYAFSHQWRANSNTMHGWNNVLLGQAANWDWSWTDRWIASRPWESRKGPNKLRSNKSLKSPNVPVHGKVTTKPRRLSIESGQELAAMRTSQP